MTTQTIQNQTETTNVSTAENSKTEKTNVTTAQNKEAEKVNTTPTEKQKENADNKNNATQIQEVTKQHQVGDQEITKEPVAGQENPNTVTQA